MGGKALQMAAIEIESLSKTYRTAWGKSVRAVQGLNLRVERGEVFGFLGPNGAGKTTTIKILAGLLRPTSGKARIFGKDVGGVDSRALMGFLPEHPSFYPHLTGYELLDLSGQLFGMVRQERKERVKELLSLVGLEDAGDLQLSKYSRGMIQRIGVAQALIDRPELSILDEPMAGLDPLGRRDVKEVILGLREQGKTVFFSTHILPDVELICDRVGILIEGRLVSTGRLDDLLKADVEAIDVTATGLQDTSIRSIGQSCQRVIRSGERVQFTVLTESRADEVQSLIRSHGGRVQSLVPRSKTLEEHFLAEVAEGERGGG